VSFYDSSEKHAAVYWKPGGYEICSVTGFDVGSSGASRIDVAMPLGYFIEGSLSPAPGKSLPSNIGASVCGSANVRQASSSGAYQLGPVPAGVYTLSIVKYDTGQIVYWSSSGLTADLNAATRITISSTTGGFDGQIPSDWP
jgi:hypothetical protein